MKRNIRYFLMIVGLMLSVGIFAQTTKWRDIYTVKKKDTIFGIANKYGLSSVEACNGYLQAGVYKPLADASERKWSWGAGLSLAAAYRFTSPVVGQEAYAELRWLKGVLTTGSKE